MSDDLVQQSIAELQDIVRCRCHPAYKDRGMHDPDCECDSGDAVKVVADRIEELEAKLAKAVEDFITVNRMAEGSGFISDHPICDGCCGIYHLTTATIAELKGETDA